MTLSSMAMVLAGTPAWVWLVLAFLVFRGVRATLPRRVGLWTPVLLPAIMMLLSVGRGGVSNLAIVEIVWLLATTVGVVIGFALAGRTEISVEMGPPAMLRLPGEWKTLGLILSIFAVRYVSGTVIAIDPAIANAPEPSLIFAILRGLLAGIFLGRGVTLALRGWTLLRNQSLALSREPRT